MLAGTDTHCPYCALQCGMTLAPTPNDGVAVRPNDFPTNRGGLCVKGWTSAALLDSPHRLTTPLIRAGGELRPADWDTALDLVAHRLREIRAEHGPDGNAVFGGGGLTNEKAYLLAARTVGFEDVWRIAAAWWPERAERVTGVYAADQLPGYRRIDDPVARERVATVWGVLADSLPGPGRSAYELLTALGTDGGPRGLLVFGSNLAVSAPHARHVTDRLSALNRLVVADVVLSDTARMADVVLPVTQWAEEEDGTITNLEGRILLRAKAVDPPEGVRTDLGVLHALATRLGQPPQRFPSAAEAVFAELRAASAGGPADYSGVTYARLRAGEALHWPVPSPGHPGTPRVFLDSFAHPDGRARFTPVDHSGPAEPPDDEFPLHATTGRILAHYKSGAQTRRVAELTAAARSWIPPVDGLTGADGELAPGVLAKVLGGLGIEVLGLNAAGGNLGVAVVPLVVPLVVVAGAVSLAAAGLIWIPLIAIATVCAWLFMDSLTEARTDSRSYAIALKEKQMWVIAVLYIGTFGSFIGFSFALPLLVRNTFPEFLAERPFVRDYLAGLGFLGALVGSLSRPLGGWPTSRLGGARITLWSFAGMGIATAAAALGVQSRSFRWSLPVSEGVSTWSAPSCTYRRACGNTAT